MLFDLSGKRRRLVQGTYLMLAILMGGGLVLFGVGSGDISGGLFDAITGKDSSSGGSNNTVVVKRIDKDEAALKLNPQNKAALADLVRSHYQLAGEDQDQQTGQFGPDGKKELLKASAAWKRYLGTVEKPDPSLGNLMLQTYSEIGLNDASKATDVAVIVADAQPSAAAYLRVAQYAQKAGRTAVAERAGIKAVDLAPKSQKKLVKQQLAAIKASALAQPSSG